MRWLALQMLASRTLLGVACALALGAYSRPASAVTVDSVGDSFTVDFDGNIGGATVAGLSASALVAVQSLPDSTLVLNVTLTNTSSVPREASLASALGFNTNPDIFSASLDSSAFSNVNLAGKFPNGFGSLDLCVINNRNLAAATRGAASPSATPRC